MDIELIDPAEALRRQGEGALIVDVRESHERATGAARGALGVAKGELEADPAAALPARDAAVLLICQSGTTSKPRVAPSIAFAHGNVSAV